MTNQQSRPPFRPLDAVIDKDLENLAIAKNVGTMVRPEPRGRAGEGAAKRTQEPTENAAPATKTISVSVDLPDYAWTELKMRAVSARTSLRYEIMTALRKAGVTIRLEDMPEDGRRDRGKA